MSGFADWLLRQVSARAGKLAGSIAEDWQARRQLASAAHEALRQSLLVQLPGLTGQQLENLIGALEEVLWGSEDGLPVVSTVQGPLVERFTAGVLRQFSRLAELPAADPAGVSQAEVLGIDPAQVSGAFVEHFLWALEVQGSRPKAPAGIRELWHVLAAGTNELRQHELQRSLGGIPAETARLLSDRLLIGEPRQALGEWRPRWDYPVPTVPEAGSAAMLDSHPITPGSRDRELGDLLSEIEGTPDGLAVLVEADVFWGKTTFMCELVRRLQESTPVVSFFNVRDGGHHRAACLVSLNAQLLHQLQPGYGLAPDDELVRQFHALLDLASAAAERTAVVVDALDEAADREMLAAALSSRPRGVTIIASSRPNPPLPVNHLLADREPLRLVEIPQAEERKKQADVWVASVVSGDDLTVEVFATLAACKGPISPADIADLWQVGVGVINAVLAPHSAWLTAPGADGEIRLGHHYLDAELSARRPVQNLDLEARIGAWADRYAKDGWPSSISPRYLLSSWPAHCPHPAIRAETIAGPWLTTALGRLPGPREVTAIASETFRDLADDYIATGDNLPQLLRLAGTLSRLGTSTDAVFPEFVAALVELGQHDKAYSYALTSGSPKVTLAALTGAPLAIRHDLLAHAIRVIRDEIDHPPTKAQAWAALIPHLDNRTTALAEVERVIRDEITNPHQKDQAWTELIPYLEPLKPSRSSARRSLNRGTRTQRGWRWSDISGRPKPSA